jgi:anti-sigma regulatory factor (Ser/Thr protein kinase)
MLEPADPWLRPRRPGPGARPAGLATTTAERPDDHVPLPAVPVAAGWARRRAVELLHARGLHPDTADDVSLLISELVTNALVHGLSAAAATASPARCAQCGGQLCLNLRDEPGAVLIEVFDAAILPPRRAEGTFGPAAFGADTFATDSLTPAAASFAAFDQNPLQEAAFDEAFDGIGFNDTERGRGLMLVASLSEEQGYYLPPTGGKVVWCVVKADV